MLLRPVLAAVLVAVVLTPAACSDDSTTDEVDVTAPVTLPAELLPAPPSTAGATPTSVPAPGQSGVTVESFVVRAPLTCEGVDFVARVEWSATGVVGATIVVDGAPVDESVPLSGPAEITLPCDGSARPVLLVLAAADGSSEIRSQAVLASPAS